MKKILCFGDSNTFGFIPENGKRYKKNIRWTGILQNLLNDSYQIMEAGCNNRTAFVDNPSGLEQTGYKVLPKYLEKEFYDVILFAIGINDLQLFFNPSLNDFETGMQKLINIAKSLSTDSKLVLVCPPKLDLDGINNGMFRFQFDEKSVEKSSCLPKIYEKLSNKNNCNFVNLNDIVKVSPIDGLHFSPESHEKIANFLYKYIKLNY